MSDIFLMLLFLLPGAISVFIQDSITEKASYKGSDLERTIEGLFLSLPCLFLTWLILRLINFIDVKYFKGFLWQIGTIEQFKIWLNSLNSLGLYFIISFISSLIIGALAASQFRPKSLLIKAISKIRASLGRAELSGYISVWDEIFSGQEEVVVEIKTANGFAKKGFVKSTSPGLYEHKEVTLEGFDVVEKYQGYLDKEALVYYNLDTGTAITLYEMEAYREQAEKMLQQIGTKVQIR